MGIHLLLENAPITYPPSVQDIIETAALISPEVGVNFNISNSAFMKEDLAEAIQPHERSVEKRPHFGFWLR
jgi:L-ribulose-5-phosphate 3-epimerase